MLHAQVGKVLFSNLSGFIFNEILREDIIRNSSYPICMCSMGEPLTIVGVSLTSQPLHKEEGSAGMTPLFKWFSFPGILGNMNTIGQVLIARF